jgi:hypothetical protein
MSNQLTWQRLLTLMISREVSTVLCRRQWKLKQHHLIQAILAQRSCPKLLYQSTRRKVSIYSVISLERLDSSFQSMNNSGKLWCTFRYGNYQQHVNHVCVSQDHISNNIAHVHSRPSSCASEFRLLTVYLCCTFFTNLGMVRVREKLN